MNKAVLTLAIFTFCLTSNVLMKETEDKDRELASINLGTLLGNLLGGSKNTTNTTSSNTTSSTPATNTTNTTQPATNNTSSSNSTSSIPVVNNTGSNNSSSAPVNNTSSTPVANNTQPADSDGSNEEDSPTNTTNTTTSAPAPVWYARNDVNMTTFAEDSLRVHNQQRMAVGLNNLTWSVSLAASAQAWAENMAKNGFRHSGKTGENIASTSYSTKTLNRLLGLWNNEKNHFIVGCIYPKCSTTSAEVGHYTQMVWHSTTQVGCGFAPGYNRGYNYLCCQYYKAGNIVGQYVY